MMKLLPVLALLFFLGCVSGGNDTNGLNSDVNDSNSYYNDFGQAIPPFVDPQDIIGDPPFPPLPPTTPLEEDEDKPVDEMTEEEYEALKDLPVTESSCLGLQYEGLINDFLAMIPQAASQGVSYEYEGVEEYKGADWCKYNVKNPAQGSKGTHYVNPFTHEVWQIAEDDGKVASSHFVKNKIVEVCDETMCKSMTFG